MRCVICAAPPPWCVQDKFFVHPAMTVLYEPRSPLRKLLGIREFDPNELISLVRVGGGRV